MLKKLSVSFALFLGLVLCLFGFPSLTMADTPADRPQTTQPKPLPIQAEWRGRFRSGEARISEPACGYIADTATWRSLWLAWRGNTEPPEIDFQSSLILVGTVSGPNRARLQAHSDSSGNIQTVVGGTRIGGPGFGYIFAKIQRAGIKAVNGRAVAPVGQTCCAGACSEPVGERREERREKSRPQRLLNAEASP